MVRRKKEKAIALILSALILALSFVSCDWVLIGVSDSCSIVQRLIYSFFHASLIHLALNLWCFLAIVFLYNVRLWHLIAAYAIAVLVPPIALTEIPTVGLSAVCFALLGIYCVYVPRKAYYNAHMAFYLVLGCLFPHINGAIHIYSYLAGLLVGYASQIPQCLRR